MPHPARGPAGDAARLARTGRWINRAIWAVALIVMAFSGGTVYQLLTQYAVPGWQAWMLAPAVDIGLCVALIGDRALHRHGTRVGWGTTLRWVTALITLALNTAGSATASGGPNVGGVLIHAVAPVLLIVLTEAGQAYQIAFAQLSAGQVPATRRANRAATWIPGRPPTASTGNGATPPATASAAATTPASRQSPASRPAGPTAKHEVAAGLAAEIRRDPGWRPDYPALLASTGMSRSWCEKRVAEARELARPPSPGTGPETSHRPSAASELSFSAPQTT